MAQARTKRIFGVPIQSPSERRRRQLAGALATAQITPGAGFGNFLTGLQSGLAGSLRAGSVYDEEQRRNAASALDTQYKQAEIAHLGAMDQPKAPDTSAFAEKVAALQEAGLSRKDAIMQAMFGQPQTDKPTNTYQTTLDRLTAENDFRQAHPEANPADSAGVAMNPATMEMAAKVYLETGQLPPMGMGKAGAQYRTQILNRAAQLAGDNGGNVAGNVASYKAQSAALRQLQMTLEGSTAFAQTAHANGQILEETLNGIPEFGFRYGNRVGRWMASQAGSPEVSRFHTALEVLTPEFGRILSQGNITGQMLTDTARKDMRAVLGGDFTKQQLRSSLDLLYRDAANKQKSYKDQIDAINTRLKSNNFLNEGGGAGSGPTQADRDYINSLGIK